MVVKKKKIFKCFFLSPKTKARFWVLFLGFRFKLVGKRKLVGTDFDFDLFRAVLILY